MFSKNRLLFSLLVILVFLLMLQAIISYFFAPIKIKEINPLPNAQNVSTSAIITIKFEKNIKMGFVEVTLSPSVSVKEEINGEVLKIIPKTFLQPATKYTIVIKDKKRNKEIFRSFFTTGSLEGSSATVQELEKETEENYPLSPYSPPNNASFYFIYTNPLQIKVFLKGNQETAKEEFLNWVKSLGVDISTHQISYATPP